MPATADELEAIVRAIDPVRPDEHLMNGARSADETISQGDIDALLASSV